jgi:uncharacterized protein (TIGR02145 family)
MKTFTLLIFTLFTSASFNLYSGQTVKIGTQEWMTKNLDVSTFRNGDPIPEVQEYDEWLKAGENKKPAWCYYDNNPSNGEKYGKLYNWYAVIDPRGLAPVGYHIPKSSEWDELNKHLQSKAGDKMKTVSGWIYFDSNGVEKNCNGTNNSGFSALPGGLRWGNGDFWRIGYLGKWWAIAANGSFNLWNPALDYGSGFGTAGSSDIGQGLSIRCLRD